MFKNNMYSKEQRAISDQIGFLKDGPQGKNLPLVCVPCLEYPVSTWHLSPLQNILTFSAQSNLSLLTDT